mmetsp:Transcript_14980/g.56429  ORF Transcript_14980/g.56429 Transcript_14980/m.56429 type:complete len:266 (+) Transcript_14980:1095-1892(+)
MLPLDDVQRVVRGRGCRGLLGLVCAGTLHWRCRSVGHFGSRVGSLVRSGCFTGVGCNVTGSSRLLALGARPMLTLLVAVVGEPLVRVGLVCLGKRLLGLVGALGLVLRLRLSLLLQLLGLLCVFLGLLRVLLGMFDGLGRISTTGLSRVAALHFVGLGRIQASSFLAAVGEGLALRALGTHSAQSLTCTGLLLLLSALAAHVARGEPWRMQHRCVGGQTLVVQPLHGIQVGSLLLKVMVPAIERGRGCSRCERGHKRKRGRQQQP